MLLGFQPRFVPFIEDGSKTHTIRAKRKIAPKVGETCHCYTGLRHKGARLLGRWKCVRVQEVRIMYGVLNQPVMVVIDGVILSGDEANSFFHRDGFRDGGGGEKYPSIVQAAELWRGPSLPFRGDLIHWEYTDAQRKVPNPDVERRKDCGDLRSPQGAEAGIRRRCNPRVERGGSAVSRKRDHEANRRKLYGAAGIAARDMTGEMV